MQSRGSRKGRIEAKGAAAIPAGSFSASEPGLTAKGSWEWCFFSASPGYWRLPENMPDKVHTSILDYLLRLNTRHEVMNFAEEDKAPQRSFSQ